MNSTVTMGWEILDRMERAVAKVRDRLLRATAALNQAGLPYAVVGGHAVASWVTTVDEGAVRNTRDIDLLVRREDLPRITAVLEHVGFVRGEVLDVTIFLDGPDAKPSESIHLLFAGEKVPRRAPLSGSRPVHDRRSRRLSRHHPEGFGPHEVVVESRQGSNASPGSGRRGPHRSKLARRVAAGTRRTAPRHPRHAGCVTGKRCLYE